jgi:hypothetical protein
MLYSLLIKRRSLPGIQVDAHTHNFMVNDKLLAAFIIQQLHYACDYVPRFTVKRFSMSVFDILQSRALLSRI